MSSSIRIGLTAIVVIVSATSGFAQSKITVLSDQSQERSGPLSRQVREMVGNLGAKPVARAQNNDGPEAWEILFATNRLVSADGNGGVEFGNGVGPLVYGRSLVAVPKGRVRRIRRPRTQSKKVVASPAFHQRLNQLVDSSVDHDVLVFVHGFNVDFDSAVQRATQIGQDMPFSGAIVSYAWPSQGSIRNYRTDEQVVQDSVEPLATFLTELIEAVPDDTRLNILVHSMGNRAVLGALNELPTAFRDQKPFQHIVFAAPDVAADVFRLQVSAATELAHQVTLYACSDDTALKASRQLHRDPGRPWVQIERAGDATHPVIEAGLHTIDVSAVDTSFMGHSYYGSNKTVLTDLLYQLKRDRHPDQCPWLHRVPTRNGSYWKMDKKRLAVLSVKQPR